MIPSDFIRQFTVGSRQYSYFDIASLPAAGFGPIGRLPFSIRILVENLLRKYDGVIVSEADLAALCDWQPHYPHPVEFPYHPARVLMQDFTGVPAVVDLAVMRDAFRDLGGDPARVNPRVPVELVVDHSIQIDAYGTSASLGENVAKEYERNHERYSLLKWAQKSFTNFRVVPPNSGICHQVNLEHLGRVVISEQRGTATYAYPDTLVGLDSHTPMINAIGVMGWGVGGIEAEAVMLGQPYYMAIPQVVGVRLTGRLAEGITATDLVLSLTELLRRKRVVEKFVEYFGPGLQSLSIPDRATIANMTPEYGATLGFFPIDERTIAYLELTGRSEQAALTAVYSSAAGLFYDGRDDERDYSERIDFDLSLVEPSLAGPSRPQDRVTLAALKASQPTAPVRSTPPPLLHLHGRPVEISDGSLVIAAITSCTNTSNPSVLIGAGLLARNAVRRGLKVPAQVKTSFAPGSKVVVRYLEQAGLIPYFEALGFHLAAFGCTTCIGNSGPLHADLEEAIRHHQLNVAAILSGNRNFEARIHQLVKSNYLASPLLVIAFALAGRIDIDLTTEPIAADPNGLPVYLHEVWPTAAEIADLVSQHVRQEDFIEEYRQIFAGDELWNRLPVADTATYAWQDDSTYIKKPPYFDQFTPEPLPPADLVEARILLLLGDSVTTDHISPAGSIPAHYPAGQYLQSQGVDPQNFNSYGSRRGNHQVMMRGTFGNIRIKNRMLAPREGSFTWKYPEGKEMYTYDAAMAYHQTATPLVVVAGSEYGSGSSRDWAAKGANLLGIKAVIARSFEKIHRNNLVGMGVLPLVFQPGDSIESLGLTGAERISIAGLADLNPGQEVTVRAVDENGKETAFVVISRLDTEVDVVYFRHGGIMPYVLRQMLAEESAHSQG